MVLTNSRLRRSSASRDTTTWRSACGPPRPSRTEPRDLAPLTGPLAVVETVSRSPTGPAKLPDPTWIDAITTLLDRARNDGGLHDDVDIPAAAYSLVYLFTGAQVSSFVNDNWTNVQHTLHTIEPFVLRALTAPGFTPRNRNQNARGADRSETA